MKKLLFTILLIIGLSSCFSKSDKLIYENTGEQVNGYDVYHISVEPGLDKYCKGFESVKVTIDDESYIPLTYGCEGDGFFFQIEGSFMRVDEAIEKKYVSVTDILEEDLYFIHISYNIEENVTLIHQEYEEFYSDIEYNPMSGNYDICEGVDENHTINIEITYEWKYKDLQDMINDPHSMFVYGQVFMIEEFNCISNSVYLIVNNTEFNDDRRLIRISTEIGFPLIEGQEYILNLIYNVDNDTYYLSQQNDSVFSVSSDKELKGRYLTDEYPNELYTFIEQFFDLR